MGSSKTIAFQMKISGNFPHATCKSSWPLESPPSPQGVGFGVAKGRKILARPAGCWPVGEAPSSPTSDANMHHVAIADILASCNMLATKRQTALERWV